MDARTDLADADAAIDPKTDWANRQRYWQRKLGRLKLGVEPIDEQLNRYRRVTWALTVVTSLIALMFIALFSAFRAPLLGLIVAGVIVLPMPAFAWLDFKGLERRAARYEAERRAHELQENPPSNQEIRH